MKIKRRRAAILILVALLLGYPAYKSGVFARVEVDVKQVCSNGVVVGIQEGTVFRPGKRAIRPMMLPTCVFVWAGRRHISVEVILSDPM